MSMGRSGDLMSPCQSGFGAIKCHEGLGNLCGRENLEGARVARCRLARGCRACLHLHLPLLVFEAHRSLYHSAFGFQISGFGHHVSDFGCRVSGVVFVRCGFAPAWQRTTSRATRWVVACLPWGMGFRVQGVGFIFKAHRRCVSLNSRLESNNEEEKKRCRVQGLGVRV